jgi:hypothetical protein
MQTYCKPFLACKHSLYLIRIPSAMKYGLKSGVAFLEGDNLVAFYYLSMSEILPDEMGDLWWEWSYKRD